MVNEINKLKQEYLLNQFFILGVLFFATWLFTTTHDMHKEQNQVRLRLEKTLALITQQLRNQETPRAADNIDGFQVFIIDEKSGRFLVDRPVVQPGQEESGGNELWQSHQAKFIYQMQKQKQGLIAYPERVSWHIWKPVSLIRYETIKELGWMVAVETALPPEIRILKESFWKRELAAVGFLFLGAMVFLWWVTARNFSLMRKTISDALESNLLSLSGESIWEDFKTAPEFRDSGRAAELKEASSKIVLETQSSLKDPSTELKLERVDPFPKAAGYRLEEESVLDKKILAGTSEAVRLKSSPLKPEGTPAPPHTEETLKTETGPRPSLPDDLTINMAHIKSDLLKKMLKELRGK